MKNDKQITKYPFIDLFVSGMMSFGAHNHVRNDMDLKTLMVFMILFKDTIKELDYYGSELSYANIRGVMQSKYDNDHGRYIYTDETRPRVIFGPPGLNIKESKPAKATTKTTKPLIKLVESGKSI